MSDIKSELSDIIKSNEVNKLTSFSKQGFFTPYKDYKDFFGTLSLPIVSPITMAIFSTASMAVAVLSATAAVVSLLISGGAAIGDDKSVRDAAFDFSTKAAIVAAFSILFAPICAFLIAAVAVAGLATFLSRSVSSVFDGVKNLCDSGSISDAEVYAVHSY